MVTRRRFLALSALPAARFLEARASAASAPSQGEVVTPHPILSTLEPVVSSARHVQLHHEQLDRIAGWMAYEGLDWPDFRSPLHPDADARDVMDFIFLTSTINFAFTDFDAHEMFRVSYQGEEWSDSEAMVACLKRAYDRGVPILDGGFLARVSREELAALFEGNIPIPMLEERLAIFHEVGTVLSEKYGGRFHRFVEGKPQRLYAGGEGLLERLLAELPSFRDVSVYHGHRVAFQKRAQLLWWNLHARFRDTGFFALEDAERLTVFADYIVPVAFRLMGITSYSDELEKKINSWTLLPADSEEEIEIRAFTIWGGHLLTRAINALRPPDRQVIDPVVDGRLWTHYHTTHWPHHLTVTTDY